MSNISNDRGSQLTHSGSTSHVAAPALPERPATDPTAILSTPQEQALEWLIGGGSVAEAAQFAGVTRQTISRWLRTDPDFRAVYEAWKLEANQMLEGRLIAAGESAMDNLINAVRVKGDVRASQFVVKALLTRKKPGNR